MHATREQWQWIWPKYGEVGPIEIMTSIALIGVLIAIAIPSYQGYVFRAHLAEAYLASTPLRILLVEQLALSGEPAEIPLTGAAVASVGFDTHLSGQQAVDRRRDEGRGDKKDGRAEDKAAKAASTVGSLVLTIGSSEQERAQAQRDAEARARARETQAGQYTSGRVSLASIVGHTIVVAGRIRSTDYELRIYPAVADEETPSVYRWLCGGRVPEGWLAQSLAVRGNLPDHLLSYDCRLKRGA